MQEISVGGLIESMKSGNLNDAVDQACEFGFTLGEIAEKDRWCEVLDNLEAKLLESEEDAKMTIHIIRKLAGVEEDE